MSNKGGIYCKCGEKATIKHRGDYVCKECRKYGLKPRYIKYKIGLKGLMDTKGV